MPIFQQTSYSSAQAYDQLHPKVQEWIYQQNWSELRTIQCMSIEHVCSISHVSAPHAVLAASTSSGKTEAALLPLYSEMLKRRDNNEDIGLVVYISPLKALINDLGKRLQLMGLHMDIPVHRWHGDVDPSQKKKFQQFPRGIVLITPESLQSLWSRLNLLQPLLVQQAHTVVVDEIHAFMGTARGVQLQMLMHYLDEGKFVPTRRIGLSATLHDMQQVANFLNPRSASDVNVWQDPTPNDWNVHLHGYCLDPQAPENSDIISAQLVPSISKDVYTLCGEEQNLIFPSSREAVEAYTHSFNEMDEALSRTPRFLAHHGNLSKSVREDTEKRLKNLGDTYNCVCTSTLELGIDIGDIAQTHQIQLPPSVAAMRQRMGRSGRRDGQSSIMHTYVSERPLDLSMHLGDALRWKTSLIVSSVLAMRDGWCEPATEARHMGILVQQLLSYLARMHGAQAKDAYAFLCGLGSPFHGLATSSFMELLQYLGSQEILEQDTNGELMISTKAEKRLVGPWLYAAFDQPEVYRVVHGAQHLGSIEVNTLLVPGQRILVAGRSWNVENVNMEGKLIEVKPARKGSAIPAQSIGAPVHADLVERARLLLHSADTVDEDMDDTTKKMLIQGQRTYAATLADKNWIQHGSSLHLLHWRGGACSEALVLWMENTGLLVRRSMWKDGEVILDSSLEDLQSWLETATLAQPPDIAVLLPDVGAARAMSKWSAYLPDGWVREDYVRVHVDFERAVQYLQILKTEFGMD